MLRARIWMGSLLAALTLGSLLLDGYFEPWYPILLVFLSVVGHLGCWELRGLFPAERRPSAWVCHLGLQAIIVANWYWQLWLHFPQVVPPYGVPFVILGLFATLLILAFLRELAGFQTPGEAIQCA